jgi:hypothetical protein
MFKKATSQKPIMPKENARELRKGKISRTIKGAIKISEHAKAVFTASMGMPLVAEKANDSIHCAKKPEPKAPAKKDPVPYIQKTVQRQETVFLLSQGDR